MEYFDEIITDAGPAEKEGPSIKGLFKKAVLVTALAVNAVTLCNSFLIADRGMTAPEINSGVEAAFFLPVAPLITSGDWRQDIDREKAGATPVGYLGDKAHKHAPRFIDGTLNAVFTIGGMPGAYTGYLAGLVVGAFTPSAKPNQSAAPCNPE